MTADASPLPERERIQALDVLRGVAVAGILFANVLVFFGLTFLPPDRAAALPTVAADRVALFLEHVFVDGKFYSLFSLLFGIGFGVQLARGGAACRSRSAPGGSRASASGPSNGSGAGSPTPGRFETLLLYV